MNELAFFVLKHAKAQVSLVVKSHFTCFPQDIVAYRTKGKVDSGSAAAADDDDDEDDEEEGEEDDDDDEDDDDE